MADAIKNGPNGSVGVSGVFNDGQSGRAGSAGGAAFLTVSETTDPENSAQASGGGVGMVAAAVGSTRTTPDQQAMGAREPKPEARRGFAATTVSDADGTSAAAVADGGYGGNAGGEGYGTYPSGFGDGGARELRRQRRRPTRMLPGDATASATANGGGGGTARRPGPATRCAAGIASKTSATANGWAMPVRASSRGAATAATAPQAQQARAERPARSPMPCTAQPRTAY